MHPSRPDASPGSRRFGTALALFACAATSCASRPVPGDADASATDAAVSPADALDATTVVPDAAPPDDPVAADAVDARSTPLRVLFVGNSYTYVNDLPALLAAMSLTTMPIAITTDAVTVGGATLQDHWQTGAALARIRAGGWRYVVLQGQSVEPLLQPAVFADYATRFAREIQTAGATAVLYETWARRAGDAVYAEAWSGGTPAEMQRGLTAAYASVASSTGSVVAAVGQARALALVDAPTIDLYAADGSHPSEAGTWLAACVFFGTLTHARAVDHAGWPASLGTTSAQRLATLADRIVFGM